MRPKTALLPIAFFLLAISNGVCLAKSDQTLQKPMSYAGQMAVATAQEFISQKKYDDALKQADIAIRSDSKSGIPYMVKAFVLDQQNEPKKAGSTYAKAIALSPDNGYVLNAFALHLCHQQQYEKADAHFLKAAVDSLYPLAYQALDNASRCALKNADLALAEQRARAALSINPESAGALEVMAQVKFKQGNSFEARAFIQRREAMAPLPAELLKLAQQIEKSAGDDRAAANYQKQLELISQAQIQPPKGEGQKKP